MSRPVDRPNAQRRLVSLAAGAALYILVERTHLLKFATPKDPVGGTPEPTTLMLLCGGALAYAACRRYARPQRREDCSRRRHHSSSGRAQALRSRIPAALQVGVME